MTVPGAYGYGGYGGSGGYGNASGFPVLGFDPAPGEVAAVHALAARFRGLAERVAQARQTLVHLSEPGSAWQGQASRAFSGTIGEMPGLMGKADQSLGEAGTALDRWSGELPRMQDQALAYERQAQAAQQQLQAAEANPALDAGGPLGGLVGEPLSPEQQQAKQQAQQALEAAQNELQRIRASAEELRGLHHQTAGQTERTVRTAMELAPDQGILEWIGGHIQAAEDWVSHKLQAAWEWTQEHAEEIAWVGDVLSTVSGALGIAAVVLAATGVGAPLAAVLGGAALAAGAAAMLAHGVAKAAGAPVSWTTIALDGAGVALGGTARAAARGVKAMRTARNTFKANREWGAARQILHGPMRTRRAIRDYSMLGGDAVGVGGVTYSGVQDQCRSVWDSDQWMGGKYKSADQSPRPPRREVSATFGRVAQGAAA